MLSVFGKMPFLTTWFMGTVTYTVSGNISEIVQDKDAFTVTH